MARVNKPNYWREFSFFFQPHVLTDSIDRIVIGPLLFLFPAPTWISGLLNFMEAIYTNDK